jgi:hypothetical protein
MRPVVRGDTIQKLKGGHWKLASNAFFTVMYLVEFIE